jgi:hypothetical protein
LIAVAATAPAASAGHVRCNGFSFFSPPTGGWVDFGTNPGEVNDLSVVADARGAFRLRDDSSPMSVRRGSRSRQARWQCRSTSPNSASAPATSQRIGLEARLGAQSDSATVDVRPIRSWLGGSLRGSSGDDKLALVAGSAPLGFVVSGGSGDDALKVSWSHPPRNRRASEDEFFDNGGFFGITDTAFLDANGGSGNDTLEVTSPTRVNRRRYLPPATLTLSQFVLSGNRGDDTLVGNAGPDYLDGGAGKDRLIARGGGRDVLLGGTGDDVMILTPSSPAATKVDCGPGNDVLELDGAQMPTHVLDCESISP